MRSSGAANRLTSRMRRAWGVAARVPAMKRFKTLKTSWFMSSLIVAVIGGEILRRMVIESFALRVPALPVAALCVGGMAFAISLLYDGND